MGRSRVNLDRVDLGAISGRSWAISGRHLRFDRIKAMLQASNGRFTAAVAFRPTGWCASSSAAGAGAAGRTLRAGATRIIEVPYSEHSSFGELQACVRELRPDHIVPTVGEAKAARAACEQLRGPKAAPVQATLAASAASAHITVSVGECGV